MTAPDEREGRLPKWAQQEFGRLRSDLESARRALADSPDSPIRARVRGNDRGLDPDADVTWTLGPDGDEIQVSLVDQRDGRGGPSIKALRLQSRHGRMVVSPGGGINVVTIRSEDW